MLIPVGFTQDHLETLFELDLEYIKSVEDKYQKIYRSKSLNDNDLFGKALGKMLEDCMENDESIQSYPTANFSVRCPKCCCKEDCSNLD